MVFNDTATRTGLVQACEGYTGLGVAGITGNTNNLYDFTRRINEANRKVLTAIFSASGLWTFDDSNQTDLPQGSANLTSGTATYALPATALTVERIEVKDSNGNFFKIDPISKEELGDGVDSFMLSNGIPQLYRLVGNTIELFPAPSYNSTNGLKVYFTRDGVDFVYSATTTTPGFASIFHNALAVMASYDWMKTYKPASPSVRLLMQDEQKYLADIVDFYSKRWKDNRPKITVMGTSSE